MACQIQEKSATFFKNELLVRHPHAFVFPLKT